MKSLKWCINILPSAGSWGYKPFLGCMLLASFFITHAQAQNFIWAKKLGGSGNEVTSNSCVSATGNIYTCGFFQNTVDFDPGPAVFNLSSVGLQNFYISKFDPNGNFIWADQLVTKGESYVISMMAIDDRENIYLAGNFNGKIDMDPGTDTAYLRSTGIADMFLAMYDASGKLRWAKQMGFTGGVFPLQVAVDKDKNLITVGNFFGKIDFDPTLSLDTLNSGKKVNSFILKSDSLGNTLWVKELRSNWSLLINVASDASGNILVAGQFNERVDLDPSSSNYDISTAGLLDIFILKLDMRGNFLWAKTFGGKLDDNLTSFKLDDSGNFYLSGNFADSIDLDAGPGKDIFVANQWDGFLSKYDAAGNYLWSKINGGPFVEKILDIAIDRRGDIILSGFLANICYVDSGNSYKYLYPKGSDNLIVKLNKNGDFIWSQQISGIFRQRIYGYYLTMMDEETCLVTGAFNSPSDLDPGKGVFNLNPLGGDDVFMLKFGTREIASLQNAAFMQPKGFPNPTHDKFILTNVRGNIIPDFGLFNALGQKVNPQSYSLEYTGSELILDMSQLPAGIYFTRFTGDAGTSRIKIAKENLKP